MIYYVVFEICILGSANNRSSCYRVEWKLRARTAVSTRDVTPTVDTPDLTCKSDVPVRQDLAMILDLAIMRRHLIGSRARSKCRHTATVPVTVSAWSRSRVGDE